MNDGIKQLLRTYLAKQNMFNIIELLNQGAEKQEIMELFEKNLLLQSPPYQNILLNSNIGRQISQQQLDRLLEIYKKAQLYGNQNNQQIYNLLQSLDGDYNINFDFDCGCGDPS